MEENRALAGWLIANRVGIEKRMAARLGPAAPAAAAPESEALRRFRSFASAALTRPSAPPPALDGLQLNERRVAALLEAWLDSAIDLKPLGEDGSTRSTLEPLVDAFRLAIRATGSGRRSRGAPRTKRRAVIAAIDRIVDAFLAVDSVNARIEDANPAAGAILGLDRDALLSVDFMAFVPKADHSAWWGRFDAVAEGAEAQHFEAVLTDRDGSAIAFDASLTRFATRGHTLALIMLRPRRTTP